MNTFTFFALVICAIFALVSAVPRPIAPAEMAVEAAAAIPIDDVLEGAESRGYNGRGGGGGRWHGGGRRRGGNRDFYGHYGHGR